MSHLPVHPSGDLAKSLLSDPRFTIEFPPNSPDLNPIDKSLVDFKM